jgi:3',5'-cyclic AMP phosphodiesterase CpdA
MTTLLHLSDLHLEAPLSEAQRGVMELLFRAVERELPGRGERPAAAVITGDLFETSSTDHAAAASALRDFCGGLRRALGADVPIFVLPGNHDRRRAGVLGPEDASLFEALGKDAGPGTLVLGNASPFLAELVPAELHGLPFHVIAYDSTILPGGLVSAGGLVRQEDLLQISAEIEALEAAAGGERRPLLLLLHHHLVPTPLTDLSPIELTRLPPGIGRLFESGLRSIVGHGDREELMMTALGAGTALSTLCSLGRPVVVLHGHKHYPTARLLKGVREDEGDILIGSAGSAGRGEPWRPTELPKEARVWPSFNRVAFEGSRVTIEQIGFSDRKPDKPSQRRLLARAEHDGRRFHLLPVPRDTDERPPPLRSCESLITLEPSATDEGATWDADVERTLRWADPALRRPADDLVEGLPDGALLIVRDGVSSREPLPARVRIGPDGLASYRIERAACRTLAEAQRRYGKLAAHEWMGLLVRHASREACLTLAGLPEPRKRPFGSVTSLTNGEERAAPLQRAEEGLSLVVRDCPPLSLLRIYWPLPA